MTESLNRKYPLKYTHEHRETGEKVEAFRLGEGTPRWFEEYFERGFVRIKTSAESGPIFLIQSLIGGILDLSPGDWVLRVYDPTPYDREVLILGAMSDINFITRYEKIEIADLRSEIGEKNGPRKS